VTVNPGDMLTGTVLASNCAAGNCTWTITNQDVTTGQSTTHIVTDTDNYNFAAGGVVEVKSITTCNQYPANGVFYSQIQVFDQNMTPVYPAWTKTVTAGLSPTCSFNVTSASSSDAKLYHNPAPAPTLTTLVTNPSPAKQYIPMSITLTGSGFDPATAQAVITGGPGSSCPTACYINNNVFSTKTSTQLVAPYFSLSITGTYTLRVRNGEGGLSSAGRNFTVVP
jgi:hypothetical protein